MTKEPEKTTETISATKTNNQGDNNENKTSQTTKIFGKIKEMVVKLQNKINETIKK